MDTYRGQFTDDANHGDDWPEVGFGEEERAPEPPPSPVGQDERRMQVRAYNHWASLLDNRNFPSIEDLDPAALPDFGPFSVLLDFTGGIENPTIQYLGDMLAEECGTEAIIQTLADVPARSLLSRITDHYMQILANQAPIGFEAEFVNQRECTILYRGILLPFSSDDDTIDFIYGVINWKELADQQTTDNLLHEIDQALDLNSPAAPHADLPMTDWADGPGDVLELEDPYELDDEIEAEAEPGFEAEADNFAGVLDLSTLQEVLEADDVMPEPAFGSDAAPDDGVFDLDEVLELGSADELGDAGDEYDLALAVPADADMELADWLASARELAEAARGSEDRTRHALYAAIGRAYDFALAAEDSPEEFSELVVDSGLTVQDRAPMTPVVKLVFGAEYDKTRLTEYASALGHAKRMGLARGKLADYLRAAPGGLKGVVAEERRLKKVESGKPAELRDTPREALARKLRKLDYQPLDAVAAEGSEFTLLVARRLPTGEVVLLGEVADDVPLLERAARKLV
ncbi:hypothetical protein [Novosphingobium sp.]|uniref:PAS domain-containing protein n=1 Tax=Novosphingobium sp. TaxID=1874826 RepID=UPI0025D67283|nr:hypothetical protein [Novosphingobium sp.]MCC6927239.1 hypothetical protein [Novosphingobium sp.]